MSSQYLTPLQKKIIFTFSVPPESLKLCRKKYFTLILRLFIWEKNAYNIKHYIAISFFSLLHFHHYHLVTIVSLLVLYPRQLQLSADGKSFLGRPQTFLVAASINARARNFWPFGSPRTRTLHTRNRDIARGDITRFAEGNCTMRKKKRQQRSRLCDATIPPIEQPIPGEKLISRRRKSRLSRCSGFRRPRIPGLIAVARGD